MAPPLFDLAATLEYEATCELARHVRVGLGALALGIILSKDGLVTAAAADLVAQGLGFASFRDLLFCFANSQLGITEMNGSDGSKAWLLDRSPNLRRLQRAGDTP